MTINQAISSCQSVYDYVINSQLSHFFLVFFFIFLPILKVIISIIKTNNKIKRNTKTFFDKVPKKLQTIITKNNLSRKMFITSDEQEYVAVSVGFLSKKIILSRKLIYCLTSKELEAVVLHEVHHSKFFHSTLLFFGEIIVKTFFFIPFLKDLLVILKTELEKSADNAAIRQQKSNKFIKSSLKKIISFDNEFAIFPQFAYYIISQRIDHLNNKKTKIIFSFKRLLFSFISILFMTLIFMMNDKLALANHMGEKITCNLFDCVQDCVAREIFMRDIPMSEINFSVEK